MEEPDRFQGTRGLRPAVAAAAKPARKRPRWLWPALAGLAGFAAILLVAGVIYRIKTDKGELVIETEDPNIEVVVKQGGKQVTIIDPQTKKRSSSTREPTSWSFGRQAGPAALDRQVHAQAGDRTVVTVSREPSPVSEVPTSKPDTTTSVSKSEIPIQKPDITTLI